MAAIIGCLSFERVFLLLPFVLPPLVRVGNGTETGATGTRHGSFAQPLKRQTIVQFIREWAGYRERLATRFTDTTVAFRAVKGFGQLGGPGLFDEFVKELDTAGKTRLFQPQLSFANLPGP